MADVDFRLEVNTPDGLKNIIIVLTKTTADDGKVDWAMQFTLKERKKATDAFGPAIIDLAVKIKPKHFAKAQATADNGLNSKQEAQAEIAAKAKKLVDAKKISAASGEAEMQKVISSR